MTFDDIRNKSDEELAKYLEKIYKTGFAIARISNDNIEELLPNFYEILKEDK